MKKTVSDFVKSLGGTTQYSGNTKTMYINNNSSIYDIEQEVIEKFGYGLLFKIQTN